MSKKRNNGKTKNATDPTPDLDGATMLSASERRIGGLRDYQGEQRDRWQDAKAEASFAMPTILRRWISAAQGELPGWAPPEQIRAGMLVAGVAGVGLEARQDGSLLAEMPLAELEASLGRTAEALRQIRALEGEFRRQAIDSVAVSLPEPGSDGESGPSPGHQADLEPER